MPTGSLFLTRLAPILRRSTCPSQKSFFGGYFIQIVLRDTDTDRAVLPFQAGNLVCRYLYETEMGRPATVQSESEPRNRNPNEVFIRTSYEKDDATPPIQGLRQAQRYDVVTLDAPGTGVLYGLVMGFSKRCLSGIEGDNETTSWVDIPYIFVGENNDGICLLPDSMRGVVVRSLDQNVVSFIQYQVVGGDWKGWCTGTSSSALLERGFS